MHLDKWIGLAAALFIIALRAVLSHPYEDFIYFGNT